MNWGSSFAYAFAAMNGFSQSQMMDLIQNKRLDPGTAVKAIANTKSKSNTIKFKNLNKLNKLKNCKKKFSNINWWGSKFVRLWRLFF